MENYSKIRPVVHKMPVLYLRHYYGGHLFSRANHFVNVCLRALWGKSVTLF